MSLTRLLVSNLGPQSAFPVPEGVLNHHGRNYVAISLWGLDASGAAVNNFTVVPIAEIQSRYQKPELLPQPPWKHRRHMY